MAQTPRVSPDDTLGDIRAQDFNFAMTEIDRLGRETVALRALLNMPSAINGAVYLPVQMEIVNVEDGEGDTLKCKRYPGNADAKVEVAKPYLLRRTPFDGEARDGVEYAYDSHVKRTGIKGGDAATEETQVVTPSYVVGDLLYAIPVTVGGTDVADESKKFVRWLDLNVDGRAWAKTDATEAPA